MHKNPNVLAVSFTLILGLVIAVTAFLVPRPAQAVEASVELAAGAGGATMDVRFVGLPAGAYPAVTVSGPNNYLKVVTSPVKLTGLRSGVYKVSAGAAWKDGYLATTVTPGASKMRKTSRVVVNVAFSPVQEAQVLAGAGKTPTRPTPDPVPTVTVVQTVTATPKATTSSTAKPTLTATPKVTATPTVTVTATPKVTATATMTVTATPSATVTQTVTATPTVTVSATQTVVITPAPTATVTVTATPAP